MATDNSILRESAELDLKECAIQKITLAAHETALRDIGNELIATRNRLDMKCQAIMKRIKAIEAETCKLNNMDAALRFFEKRQARFEERMNYFERKLGK